MDKLRGGAALALLVGALAGVGNEARAEGATFGALIPLTGGLQSYGEASLNGMKLAVKEINAAGGVLGGDVKLVVGDTQTKAQAAIDAAQKLVSVEGACCILGALSSGNTIPVATSVTSRGKVPQITNASTAPTITTLDDGDFLFRTVPSDAGQGIVLGRLVKAQGTDKVAVVYVNNDYGQGLAEAFQASFKKEGGTVTGATAFEPNKASYRGELDGLAKGDAEALLVIAYPDDGGLLITRQALEEGLFDRFIFTDGMKTTALIDQIGDQYMEGVYGTSPKAAASDASARFGDLYNAEYGQLPPLPYIDTAYDAAMIMALAVDKAGSTDGTAIRDALREVANAPGEKVGPGDFAKAKEMIAAGKDIDYDGAGGAEDFDAHGDVKGTFEHWAVKDGKLTTVDVVQD
ncbi:MAG: ABC transporter substrate-binding protein [Geminicoccaceae bacterium]|nr:ABC transporter substrate-binding protein [Geminicoccaceae bacterium]